MSGYGFREHSTGGAFKSFTTGKEYLYEKTWDHADKRRAKSQMDADDRAFNEAAAARATRTPTPDNRTTRERVRDESVSQKPSTANVEGAFATEIANLEKKLQYPQLPEDKARIRRRIAMYKEGLAERVEKREVAEAETARRENPEYLRCLADAELEVQTLSVRPDIPQEFVDMATANLKTLTESTDVAAYKAASAELTNRYKQLRQSQIDELRARKAELEAEIQRTKKDEIPESEPTESSEV